MSQEVIVVFTAKSIERILEEGGTSAWRLDHNHARRCDFAVCTRNAHAHWDQSNWAPATEAHRTAFLVGKIHDVVPCPTTPEDKKAREGRYLVKFSEMARVEIPNLWKGDRNPVKYMSFKDLGINPSTLQWEPMPEPVNAAKPSDAVVSINNGVKPLTMGEAKKGLALTFNVPPDAIEITIRG